MTKLKKLIWLAENVLHLPAGKLLHYAPPWDNGYVHPDTAIRETGQTDDQGRAVVIVKRVHKPFYIPRADCLLISEAGIKPLVHFDPFTDEAQAINLLDEMKIKHIPPTRTLDLALRDLERKGKLK